jgi:GH15 family glucan-1,4-alpha-glucosidase
VIGIVDGPVERWRALRDRIHTEVCARGFHPGKRAFTQAYGSDALDASLLMTPLVGFLPPTDERVIGTVRAIERELVEDGFVLRHRTKESTRRATSGRGLVPRVWLADNYALMGRKPEARALFERPLSLRNDVGLLTCSATSRRRSRM